jgi:1-acyl-sn-glycerol-3-phosphate acyltransferase
VGHPLLVFPEGTRSGDGRLSDGQRGVGLLVAKSKVPVLPAKIEGAFEILGKGKSIPRLGRKLKVSYGPQLGFNDLDPGKSTDNRYDLISQRIMSAISEIK